MLTRGFVSFSSLHSPASAIFVCGCYNVYVLLICTLQCLNKGFANGSYGRHKRRERYYSIVLVLGKQMCECVDWKISGGEKLNDTFEIKAACNLAFKGFFRLGENLRGGKGVFFQEKVYPLYLFH